MKDCRKAACRNLKIGKKLAQAIIIEARKIGYTSLRGDTAPSMKVAQALYASLGFKTIQPYRYNPIQGALFIELDLSTPKDICMRDFKPSDLNTVKNLIESTINFSYPAFYNDEAIAFFKHHHCDENISKDAKEGHTIVLEQNGEIIGTGTILDNEIKRVFIDPAFQKHGFGKLIMHHLETKACAQGIKLVKLDASLPAKKFYDSLGYITVEAASLEVADGKKLGLSQNGKDLS